MRFMMLVQCAETAATGGPMNADLVSAIGALSEEMMKAGVLLDTGGLLPSGKGARITIGGGSMSVIDGPFSETKEMVGGYAILRVSSKEEAIEHGKRFMALHTEILGPSYEAQLEIRQMFDAAPEVTGAELREAWREQSA